ncbi:MAG: hypothetical protein AAFP26_14310, partial [Planctomycetota bacterium]
MSASTQLADMSTRFSSDSMSNRGDFPRSGVWLGSFFRLRRFLNMYGLHHICRSDSMEESACQSGL